jgi:hypothetical protein
MSPALPCLAVALALVAAAPDEKPREPPLTAELRAHWSFRPPVRTDPPEVREASRVRNPIDAFILARLEKTGLRPAAPAERAVLLRRVTFDLTGLPPTPQELDDFLNDNHPDAYERVVERLLASPHFGERWAEHWLDVVRYAESNGYEADAERPHAWRYRDYVVRALNDDMPYDRFLTEQLAGDLLARDAVRDGITGADRPEAAWLVAAGMNRCGPIHQVSGNVDPVVNRQELLTEMTATVGSAFLGLTVGCARCHDHKFDPISQADYYRLQAFFSPAQPKEVDLSTPEEREAFDRRTRELDGQLTPLREQVQKIEAPYREQLTAAKKARLEPAYREALEVDPKKRTPEQKKLAGQAQTLINLTWDEVLNALTPEDRQRRAGLRAQIHALEAQRPAPLAKAWTIVEDGSAPVGHVLRRGDPLKKGATVESAFPRVLCAEGKKSAPETHTTPPLNRLDLARWLTRPDHPLTARVVVNRLWQHHFGRGLVGTPNDFGVRGETPSHPELLDWLATELVAHHWSLKHLHRLMVLSNTYRQESQVKNEAAQKIDPDNKFLWRMNRRRLSAEALRDGMLAVAGTLNPRLGGPHVRVPLEPEVYDLIFTEGEPDNLWPVSADAREHTRRSLYLFAKRNVRLPLLEAFDQPDTLTSCPVRPVSTFAPQALILMNGPVAQEQSKAFAGRLLREPGTETASLIERAYRLALARPPREAERRAALEFLQTQADHLRDRLRARQRVGVPAGTAAGVDPAEAAALADFCLALFNRNEFLYVP